MHLRCFCFLIPCILGALSASAHAEVRVVQGIPGGFENLAAPRPTVVTLSYGGRELGHFAAHTTPGTLQLDAPESVLAAIPALSRQDKVRRELMQPLPVHAGLLCGKSTKKDCGKLTPEVVGVIYDENTLAAELFVHKNYLDVVVSEEARYLPLPERAFSSLFAFSGAIAGVTDQATVYSISNNALYAYGEGRLNTFSTFSNEGLRFDTAALSVERNGWSAAAGLFRSAPMQLISDRDIAGLAFSTSTRTRLETYKMEGNDIIVYLPRRSFVSIYREGRLYSSRLYEAGNQFIDTSELPEGAYTINLRIQEPDGGTRDEARYFAKSPDLPPPDAPAYYVQAGVLRKPPSADSTMPQLTDKLLVRLGTVRRVDDNVGLKLGALGLRDNAAAEAGLFWMRTATQLRGTALASLKGDIGVQSDMSYSATRLGAAANFVKVWSKNTVTNETNLFSSFMQGTANFSYAVTPDISFGMRGSYFKTAQNRASTSFGPYAGWRLWSAGESELAFSADTARTDGRTQGTFLLRLSHRFGDNGFSSVGGYGYGQPGRGGFGSARLWHDHRAPGERLVVGGGMSADSTTRGVNADLDWRNQFGRAAGSVQNAWGRNGSTFSYGGSFAFNVAQVADDIHIGGTQDDRSAIIVETAGDADTDFTIFVNSAAMGTVRAGGRQALYLSPFHTYKVRLAAAKAGLFDLESGERKVTLYPGNVVKLNWIANTFYVVAGRLVNEVNEPLADAVLQEGKAQVATDADGRFQAELAKPETLTFKTQNGLCRAALPVIKPVNGVLLYRDLTCAPLTQTAAR